MKIGKYKLMATNNTLAWRWWRLALRQMKKIRITKLKHVRIGTIRAWMGSTIAFAPEKVIWTFVSSSNFYIKQMN